MADETMANQRGSTRPLRGAMTALVTPFRDGSVDWQRYEALIDRQIEAGTDWLVPCGTTGESPTLTTEEHARLIATAVQRANGRCGILAGTGTNSTAETTRRTKEARSLGVDAVMVVAPYYNRPSQEGLFRHFAAVADAVDLPIVLYNVPARTGVDVGNECVVRLRKECPNVAALKHATGSVGGVTDLLGRCDIAVLSGDDALTLPLLSLGAAGVISVVGNLVPGWMKTLVDAWFRGDHAEALAQHRRITALADGIGRYGPNPIPIKTAMAVSRLLIEEFRLPLCPVAAPARGAIEALLRGLELS